MGLYQLIVSVYVLGSTFASSGLSTATTRLITDELVCGDPRSVRRILRRALSLSTVIAVLSTLLFYLGAPLIGTYWIRDARAVPAIRVLSLSFPFMGISSCIKGYFMARRRVASSSRAQQRIQIASRRDRYGDAQNPPHDAAGSRAAIRAGRRLPPQAPSVPQIAQRNIAA